ncbi:MAG TPA: hypothetical protein DCX53_08335 [Anaerolineae bacterium]|nr:hypothetical protein [Anaerolineae bacterium]
MPRETIARYEIKSELGRGGMASVYLAYDPNFRRNVAIKLISVNLQENISFRERFEREAHLIAKIEHPAIVPVYDYGEQDDQLYLVMRYMPGGTLTDKLKQGLLAFEYTVQLISQIAPALDAVHAQKIVHRDLKPGNILFDGFGNPALSDFGIAHLTASTIDLTGSAIIGTPSYMSPEQVRSDSNLDGRSDIYALGIILFEMLTGRGPYQAATPLSIALKHLTDPIPSIRSFRPDLPIELENTLAKALAKDREIRHATASELALELREIARNFQEDKTPNRNLVKVPPADDVSTEIDMPDNSQPSNASPHTAKANKITSTSTDSKPLMPGIKHRWSTIQIASLITVGLFLFLLCSSLGLFGVLTGLPNIFPGENQNTPQTLTASQDIILFEDDFSDPLSGWPTIQNTQGGYSYQPDGYHITVNEQNAILWAKTNREDDNATIQTDAQPSVNGANSYYGLLCRIQDDQNFYYFLIRSNGGYNIGKYKNSVFEPFFPEGWRQSDAINQGEQTNHIKADCLGETLRLSVNNVILGEATDSEFATGASGIVAAALDNQVFDVIFNNFLITKPGQ